MDTGSFRGARFFFFLCLLCARWRADLCVSPRSSLPFSCCRRRETSPVPPPPVAGRDCAIGPATRELPLDPAPLGEAVLTKLRLADAPGGVPIDREVLRSVDRWVERGLASGWYALSFFEACVVS